MSRLGCVWLLAAFITLLTSCAWQQRAALDRAYGIERPRTVTSSRSPGAVDFVRDVKPILDSRCAVCHGCYDAPCQLNLTAYEGIDRGANKNTVYDGSRLIAARLTRLFEDARNAPEWRERGFYPVLNERDQTSQANLRAGVMARMLGLKHENPLPAVEQLPDSFDFSLNREQQCPRIEEFESYADRFPQGGMPYGLPGLGAKEHETVMRWLEQGAADSPPEPSSAAHVSMVDRWEAFLNGPSMKEQLMSRYLYEHLFLGHLYFPEIAPLRYYRLVRSRTPPGKPIDPVFTRRPYDDPGVPRVFYRLKPLEGSVLVKTHMPYALSQGKLQRYRDLFLAPSYPVAELPSYRPESASNPFVSFRALPIQTRYRFLLDDAEFFVMGFIKGPVCRGQVALNVIDDRFWVFFVDPDSTVMARSSEFLARESSNLRLPSEQESNPLLLTTWLRYSQAQRRYLSAKQQKLESALARREDITLGLVWDGGGEHNPNAALTVFRHFDSASVAQGMIGKPPKTAWLVNFSLLERIHYLLVAGFDVYGNVGHQLFSRLYMDFLRMEGESNFLILLPAEVRTAVRDYWYRGASDEVKDYMLGRWIDFNRQTNIPYATRQPETEIFELLRRRLGSSVDRSHDLDTVADPSIREPLQHLMALQGGHLSLLPQTSLITVIDPETTDAREADVYTLTEDAARANISHLFREQRLPDEDRLTVAKGIAGAYPNAFFAVRRGELPAFSAAVANLASEADYARLLSRFGIRRTDTRFWSHSDDLHRRYHAGFPVEAGILDLNRFENR